VACWCPEIRGLNVGRHLQINSVSEPARLPVCPIVMLGLGRTRDKVILVGGKLPVFDWQPATPQLIGVVAVMRYSDLPIGAGKT